MRSLYGEEPAPGPRRVVERHRSALEQAWVTFLAPYEWQWFATFTFREAIHPEAADKKFRYWVRLLNERNVGHAHWRPNKRHLIAQWCRGLEWQKRDVLHYHALIANLPPFGSDRAEREHWAATWAGLDHSGFAYIKPVAETGGVVGYVSKYVAKGGQVDLSPSLPRFVPQLAAVDC